MIAVVTALREELAPLLRRAEIERVERPGGYTCHVGTLDGTPVVLMAGGEGLLHAEASLRALLERFDVTLIVGAGIAGAVDGSLRTGDVVVAGCVRAEDGQTFACAELGRAGVSLTNSAEKTSPQTILSLSKVLARKHTIDATHAVDTESVAWARVAAARNIPFVAVRVIFDELGQDIPPFIAGAVNADGSSNRASIVRHALTHPASIPTLLRMRAKLNRCSEALAGFLAESLGATDAKRLDELLVETSRTFAVCIPLLPDTTRLQVTIAYLLFRIVDTFEDASHWPVAVRLEALDAFCALLRNPQPEEARQFAESWHARNPSPHQGYCRLIADIPLVLRAFTALDGPVQDVIADHVIRSAQGMGQFVSMTAHGRLQLTDMQQLRDYCYAVAGIVGEMLTELFLIRAPELRHAAPFLRARAATFGEGLQLVNILKDSASDLSEGRTYIPPSSNRADVSALARRDLEAATEYTLSLQSGGAPKGIVAFAALPVALAQATLDRLDRAGAGAKIGRAEVFRITRRVNQLVAAGNPPLQTRPQPATTLARMRSIFSLPFGKA